MTLSSQLTQAGAPGAPFAAEPSADVVRSAEQALARTIAQVSVRVALREQQEREGQAA